MLNLTRQLHRAKAKENIRKLNLNVLRIDLLTVKGLFRLLGGAAATAGLDGRFGFLLLLEGLLDAILDSMKTRRKSVVC